MNGIVSFASKRQALKNESGRLFLKIYREHAFLLKHPTLMIDTIVFFSYNIADFHISEFNFTILFQKEMRVCLSAEKKNWQN